MKMKVQSQNARLVEPQQPPAGEPRLPSTTQYDVHLVSVPDGTSSEHGSASLHGLASALRLGGVYEVSLSEVG